MSPSSFETGTAGDSAETALAEFRPDRRAYWRGHLIMAVLGGFIAGVALVVLGNPSPWVGPVAAILAVGVRGGYLASEVMAMRWTLTNHRLVLPGGRAYRLVDITKVRAFLGDVQIVTRQGDKHLVKYQADAEGVIARINDARDAA